MHPAQGSGPSARSLGRQTGDVADRLARTLLDTSACPSCGTRLVTPLCPRCGVDLRGGQGDRVWQLAHAAVLALRERDEVLALLRAEAARRSAPDATRRVAPAADRREQRSPSTEVVDAGVPFGPPPEPSRARRGPAVPSLLVGLGALLLAVAAVVFLAVAWDLLGLAGRAAVVAVLTVVTLAAAVRLRPRLPETAEALGAIGAVLVVGDGWAARATGLAGAGAVPAELYAAAVAALSALFLGALGLAGRLRAGTLAAALLAPAAPVLLGLYLVTVDDLVLPVAGGLLAGALVAAGRGLLPSRLGAEAAVARVVAVAGAGAGTLLAAVATPRAAGVLLAAIGAGVLALQALADHALGARSPAGAAPSVRTWTWAWCASAGAAVVAGAALAVLALPDGAFGPDEPGAADLGWARVGAVAVAAALAAMVVLAAALRLPGTAPGRRLVERGLRRGAFAAGAGGALAAAVLPVAGGALGALEALARVAQPPWRARPGDLLAELAGGSPLDAASDRLWLAAGLVVPGLLAACAPQACRRWGSRRATAAAPALEGVALLGQAATAAAVVLLATMPGTTVASSAALLAAVAVAAGLLTGWERAGAARPALLVMSGVTALAAVVVGWTSATTSGPVTGLAVLGLLAARAGAQSAAWSAAWSPAAPAAPAARAALAAATVVTSAAAAVGLAAPVLGLGRSWALLTPGAATPLVVVGALVAAATGIAVLALPLRDPEQHDAAVAETRAAVVAAALVGALALTWTPASLRPVGSSGAAAAILAGLLALAVTTAARSVVAASLRPASAFAVPVLAAAAAAQAAVAAGAGRAGGLPTPALAALLVAVAAAGVLVALALRVPTWAADARRLPAEAGAAVAALAGLADGGSAPDGWLLYALAGTGLACLAVTPGRGRLADASVLPFAIASGLLLDRAGVDLVEAYTLPPAAALLLLGAARLRAASEHRSWPALGPGLVLALAPAVVVAADRGPVVRVVVLTVAAGGVLLAGVRWRLAAPVVVGGSVLAAHAVAQLGPALVELGSSVPRWTVLATVGALLLVVGATYERQARQLRAAASRLAGLR